MMPPFSIENIAPLAYPDMWTADVILRRPEMINDADVAQVAKITVRFHALDSADMPALVDAAARKVEESLSTYAEILAGRSGDDLLSDYRQKTRKSYEFTPFDEPTE